MLGIAAQYSLWQMSKCRLPQGKRECSLEDARFCEICCGLFFAIRNQHILVAPRLVAHSIGSFCRVPLPDDKSSWVED